MRRLALAAAVVCAAPATAAAQAWEEVSDLDGVVVRGVGADTTDPDVLLAGGSGEGAGCGAADKVAGCDVYRSTDGGTSFAVVTSTVNRIDLRAVAISGVNGVAASLDVGDGEKVLHSDDGGATWATAATGSDFGETEKEIAFDPSTPTTVYVGDFELAGWTVGQAYILKSINGGADWAHVPETAGPGGDLRGSGIEVDSAGVVWVAGTGTPFVARSTDGGTTWPSAAQAGMDLIASLAIDPDDPSTVFAGTIEDGVYRTENDGVNWTTGLGTGLPTVPPNSRLVEMIVDPLAADTVYAATQGAGVFVSVDNGANWAEMNDGLAAGAQRVVYDMAMTADFKLFIGTDDGAFVFDLDPDPPTPDAGVPDANVVTADAGADEPDADPGPGAEDDAGGCGCRTGGGSSKGAWLAGLLLGAGALLRRRRRRKGGDWDTRPAPKG